VPGASDFRTLTTAAHASARSDARVVALAQVQRAPKSRLSRGGTPTSPCDLREAEEPATNLLMPARPRTSASRTLARAAISYIAL